MGKFFVFLISAIFFVYGLLFIFIPQEALQFVVQTKMGTNSGVIDIRATYGGMSVAVGLFLYVLAKEVNTLRLGLLSVFILMAGMALGRIVGMLLDGKPNGFMYLYLVLELFSCVLSFYFLRVNNKYVEPFINDK